MSAVLSSGRRESPGTVRSGRVPGRYVGLGAVRRGRASTDVGPVAVGAVLGRRASLRAILPFAPAVAIAQWQSSGLWNRRLRVRAPLATPIPPAANVLRRRPTARAMLAAHGPK